jgi:thiosulfate reductase cytochrome b subunit
MFLYPLWVRLWHLLNAILILILIFTGISIHYPNEVGSFFIIDLSKAINWHSVASKILIVSYASFIIGNIFTANGHYYRISRKNFFRDLGKQVSFTMIGIFRHEKKPFPATLERKFNPLQKLTYVIIMYIALPLMIITGIGLMVPELFPENEFGTGAFLFIDLLHIIIAFIIAGFLVIHIYMATTLGSKPTSGLRSMISGYAESEEE